MLVAPSALIKMLRTHGVACRDEGGQYFFVGHDGGNSTDDKDCDGGDINADGDVESSVGCCDNCVWPYAVSISRININRAWIRVRLVS